MLILSKKRLEDFAQTILSDYYGTTQFPLRAIDPIVFAENYLNLAIRFDYFPATEQKILGFTAYQNMRLIMDSQRPFDVTLVEKDTIYINANLVSDRSRGLFNFTVAHECAHQLLYRLEVKRDARISFRTDRAYSLRELHDAYDWNEWQADVLAAALLMPSHILNYYMHLVRNGKPFTCESFYRGRILEYKEFSKMASFLGVSGSALRCRLQQLNMMVEAPGQVRQNNPLDIFKEEAWPNIKSMKVSVPS